jgi:hypothetical protein
MRRENAHLRKECERLSGGTVIGGRGRPRSHAMGVFDSNFDERESHLRVLADQLFFTVEKNGDRFILKRTADVSEPVCESNLGLDEAEELLRAWKLRGHGG